LKQKKGYEKYWKKEKNFFKMGIFLMLEVRVMVITLTITITKAINITMALTLTLTLLINSTELNIIGIIHYQECCCSY
jgi:diacylglycerol kinase